MNKSKYYYDYTRNMSVEQEMEMRANNNCGKPTCELKECTCCKGEKNCPNKDCTCPNKTVDKSNKENS